MEIEAKERELALLRNSIAAKEREYCDIWQSVEDRTIDLVAMEETLKSVQNQIAECDRNFRLKEEDCNCKLEMMDRLISDREIAIEMYGLDLGAKESRLCVVEGLIREREQELQAKQIELRNIDKELRVKMKEKEFSEFSVRIGECNEEEELDLMQRLKKFEGRVKEIELRENQFEGQAKELESQEKQFIGRGKELASKEKQFEGRVKEIELREKQLEGQAKELESKEKHLEGQLQKLESKRKRFEEKLKEFDSKQKHFKGQMKEFESEKKRFRGQVKAHSSKEKKQYDGQVKELKAKEKLFEVRAKELESKEKEFEEQMKDFEAQKNQYEGQMKAIELRKLMLDEQLEGHKSKEKQFEAQMKDLESKRNQYEEKLKELELKEAQFSVQLKELKSREKQSEDLESKMNQYEEQVEELEAQQKMLESEWNLYEEKLKELELKEAQFSVQLKELKSKEKQFEDLESKRDQYEEQVKELELKEAQFRLALKKLESEEKQFEGRLKDLESKQNQFGRQQKELELKENRCESLRISFEEGQLIEQSNILVHQVKAEPQDFPDDNSISKYNQLMSPTTSDGRNLQLLSNEPELIGNDILDCLQTSADPAALVLDIIQNPIVPQDRNGNEGIIIDESHIILLDQLMRISPSPRIKPDIRDAAKKLATGLKANMNPCDENSLVVLGFLLLLSIYGLVSYFNEDEVFKLLEFAAEHKQAIELFRTLGFADKIAVFVQNLVEKKQYVDAARFICAYKLAYKINPIDLLRFEISRAEQISKKIGRQKPIEQKVRCKELELGILRKVLQCISDNNIGSHQDLVNSVQDRILSLERRKEELIVLAKQKEELCRLVSKLSSALEVRQPEEKKCANKEFTENQVHQPEDKIGADIAVTDNQVKVQQPKEKESANGVVTKNQVKVQQPKENKSANGAVTKNHVKVKQPEAQKPADRAVTMNQVQGQQPEENISTNEAVAMNQVQVEQTQEKKRPIEAVPNDQQLHQWGLHNKRPRTGPTHSLPRVFTSHYQHTFCPSGMPAPFGLPPDYYGGADYFCHPRPYPPFR